MSDTPSTPTYSHYWDTLVYAYRHEIATGTSSEDFWRSVFHAASSPDDSQYKIAPQAVHNAVYRAAQIAHPELLGQWDAIRTETRRIIGGWDRSEMMAIRHRAADIAKAFGRSSKEGHAAMSALASEVEGR